VRRASSKRDFIQSDAPYSPCPRYDLLADSISGQGPNSRHVSVLLAFDIYGTVVDPRAVAAQLSDIFGERAPLAAQLWRAKQLEFTFRRALMRRYVDFDVCTAQALECVSANLGVRLDAASRDELLRAYRTLPAFPEVRHSLETLHGSGYRTVALSNGTLHSIQSLLAHAGLTACFDAVLSADTIATFKPDPAVYELAVRAAGIAEPDVCLISANSFDVIGAKAVGLKAAWVRRGAEVFDPWEYQPDVTVRDLRELSVTLPRL